MEPQQILRILRRQGWKVLCWGIAIAVLVGVASRELQTKIYESGAQVLLQQTSPTQSFTQHRPSSVDPASFATSQVIVIESIAVAREASALIPGHPSPDVLRGRIHVAISPTNTVLTIIARSEVPAETQATANAVARAYIANRYTFAIGNLRSAVNDIGPQLTSLQKQFATLETQINIAAHTKGGGASVAGLTATRDAVHTQYQALFSQQEQLQIAIKLTRSQAELVGEAGLPSSPVSPKPRRDAELGLIAGLLIGLGIALLREKFDDKVSSAEELEKVTAQPVLAQIPSDDSVAAATSPAVIRPGEFSEAIRTLRTGLQFLGVEHPLRRIVVSSAGTGDGKTTVAANLAVAYAEAGFVTVLVSGDLRRPQLEKLFGSPPIGFGLSTLLATATMRPRSAGNGNGHVNGNGNGGHVTDERAQAERTARMTEFLRVQSITTTIPNLTVIPGGPTPPNPAELLGSTRMREILDILSASSDVIIIDTPPALVVTDSVVLSDMADGVLVVASAAQSTRRDLTRLMATYEAADVPVLGTVLNRAPRSRGKSAYYSSYYSAPRRDRVSPPITSNHD